MKKGNSHISVLYPGLAFDMADTGIGSIGRIDQADIHSGTTIKMHPHVNDEILSYFRVGRVVHTDSAGTTETINRGKLMLMKAGQIFQHEETIVERLEGLQIFIRPAFADYSPEVSFFDLDPEDSLNAWRMLAANGPTAPLKFTSETELLDMTITTQRVFALPGTRVQHPVFLLYVFQGNVRVNGTLQLSKGECVLTDEPQTVLSSEQSAEVVLFITNSQQNCYKNGMFSGNKT